MTETIIAENLLSKIHKGGNLQILINEIIDYRRDDKAIKNDTDLSVHPLVIERLIIPQKDASYG